MGWGYGVLSNGREIGYSVEAICDKGGCEIEIDRGLSQVCGGMHEGGEHGCGDYFCDEHLVLGLGAGGWLCEVCFDKWVEHPDFDHEEFGWLTDGQV